MTESKEAYHDPLVSYLIDLETLSPTGKYYLGMTCASIAGTSLSISHFISKSTLMTEEHPIVSPGLKKILSSMCTLFMAVALLTVFEEAEGKTSTDNLFAELFWIGVFSLTAKAALSISYDDEETNPVHCRLMGLIGLFYCFLVDQSIFTYDLAF